MTTESQKKSPWYLWPFEVIWNLVTWILSFTGRLIAAVLGLILMILGAVLTVTIIAAPIGLPLALLGLLLMVRSIF